MIVRVDAATVFLDAVDRFDNFHVENGAGQDLQDVLSFAAAGEAREGFAWVSTRWIEARAASIAPDFVKWREGFEAMVRYAESQGWISENGDALRAHVVRVASSPGRTRPVPGASPHP